MRYVILKNESKDRHFVKGLKRFALAVAAVGCMMIMILSIMVGIFISKIFVPMLPYPKYRSIAYA